MVSGVGYITSDTRGVSRCHAIFLGQQLPPASSLATKDKVNKNYGGLRNKAPRVADFIWRIKPSLIM